MDSTKHYRETNTPNSSMEGFFTYNAAIVIVFLLLLFRAQAQSAAAPAPPGPLNVTKVLEKAGQFSTLIRLMKGTQVLSQINNELNNSNGGAGLTLFAPTDNAFSSLPSGTLNSLTDQEKVSLIQFHVIPNLITMSQFQTVSNPVRTQAGSEGGAYPLNVTAAGNQVNISTGVDNATISNTLYTDSSFAVYEVDKVLMPVAIFKPSALAPAPGPAVPEKKKKKGVADSPTSSDTKDGSAAADSAAGRLQELSAAARGFIVALGLGFPLLWTSF